MRLAGCFVLPAGQFLRFGDRFAKPEKNAQSVFSAEGFNLKLTSRDSLKNRANVIAPEPIAPGTSFALNKDVLGGSYGKRN